jgi:hypothetical protein
MLRGNKGATFSRRTGCVNRGETIARVWPLGDNPIGVAKQPVARLLLHIADYTAKRKNRVIWHLSHACTLSELVSTPLPTDRAKEEHMRTRLAVILLFILSAMNVEAPLVLSFVGPDLCRFTTLGWHADVEPVAASKEISSTDAD